MKTVVLIFSVLVVAGAVCAGETPATFQMTQGETGLISDSITHEAEAAIQRGILWLADRQQPDGHWSDPDQPALTALPLWALLKGPDPDRPIVDRAIQFILSCAHDDGAIENQRDGKTPDLDRTIYNTAHGLIALHATGKPDLIPVVQNARRFLAGISRAEDTFLVYEAMRLTQQAGKAELDWETIRASLPDKDNPWVELLTCQYAGIDRNDPRVQALFEEAIAHWTLEENADPARDGLYGYYNVLAKALALYGQDVLTLSDGRSINWRSELVRTLINAQKTDPKTGNGYWADAGGRGGESDPVLATSQALLALEIALNR